MVEVAKHLLRKNWREGNQEEIAAAVSVRERIGENERLKQEK